jgi:hypothetical protein
MIFKDGKFIEATYTSTPFLMYLEQKGHIVEEEKDLPMGFRQYRLINFSPEKLVGFVIHTMISSNGRETYFTDTKKIYYPYGGKIYYKLGDFQKEDVLREDELLTILDATPQTIALYEEVDGHLRLNNFDYCFNGRRLEPGNVYADYLAKIYQETPGEIIRKDEKFQISRRIKRNYKELSDLFTVLYEEEPPYPKFASILEKTLANYGYFYRS